MIVRIVNILGEFNDNSMITDSCYAVVQKDFITLESAYEIKKEFRRPEHYIIVEYFT